MTEQPEELTDDELTAMVLGSLTVLSALALVALAWWFA